jgi:hypothetical protein
VGEEQGMPEGKEHFHFIEYEIRNVVRGEYDIVQILLMVLVSIKLEEANYLEFGFGVKADRRPRATRALSQLSNFKRKNVSPNNSLLRRLRVRPTFSARRQKRDLLFFHDSFYFFFTRRTSYYYNNER